MTAARRCSECGEPLTDKGPHAKTCSPKCRSARSRRLKRQRKERGAETALPPHQKELAEAIEREKIDAVHEVIKEEVRPVVRESITEDTIQAIGKMVGLTGVAIAALTEDLASDDATIRQRAYTLLLKYTVGHQAIVRPPDEDRTQPIEVNFALPRPERDKTDNGDTEILPTAEVVDAQAEELRTCDTCGREDTADKFAANSTRCLDCYAKQRARADEFLRDYDGS